MKTRKEIRDSIKTDQKKTSNYLKETQHTPTPWLIRHGREIMSPSNNYIAQAQMDSISKEEAEANAAFIVRAVNSHEALLESLKIARNYVSASGLYPDAVKHFDAVIAKAEDRP